MGHRTFSTGYDSWAIENDTNPNAEGGRGGGEGLGGLGGGYGAASHPTFALLLGLRICLVKIGCGCLAGMYHRFVSCRFV